MLELIVRMSNKKIVIYQARSGAIELRGDFSNETLWANRMQMAEMFGVNPQAISKHIKNIYKEKELAEKATSSKMELVQTESGRTVTRQVDVYNLDMIIAIGYRINSVMGTNFRIWATKTLRSYITDGYVINRDFILKNYENFLKTVSDIQALLPTHTILDPKSILELVKDFSVTWTKLDAYDKDKLFANGVTKKKIKVTGGEVLKAIEELKTALINKDEATDIFAVERIAGSMEGIIGNVMQSFDGNDVYQTLEEKSAHLLYFIVKNHPFIDGNKRSAAFVFIWFLKKNGVKGFRNINPSGLTAITLLIAESNPEHKNKMTALVVELLRIGK